VVDQRPPILSPNWTPRFGRPKLFGRIIDYETFYLPAASHLWHLVRSGDLVIAKTGSPVLSVFVVSLCLLREAKLVNWLQNISPDVNFGMGSVRQGPFRVCCDGLATGP
jgi:hypothetical protein